MGSCSILQCCRLVFIDAFEMNSEAGFELLKMAYGERGIMFRFEMIPEYNLARQLLSSVLSR